MTVPEDSRRPAAAYEIMAKLLGHSYFVRNIPPQSGVQLTVAGPDNVPTDWWLSENIASKVARHLERLPVRVSAKSYDDRRRAA